MASCFLLQSWAKIRVYQKLFSLFAGTIETMSIEVTCQACRKTYRVKEDVSGKRIRCPSCKEIVVVPVLVQEFYVDDSIQASVVPSGPKGPSGRVPDRKQRDYTHLRCGAATTIDGPEFQALADPLAQMVATYCAGCEEVFPIDQFAWSDTGEKISDYYLRYQQLGSPLQNFLVSRTGMFALAAVPFVLAMIAFVIFRNNWLILAGVFSVVLVIVLHTVALGPIVLKQVVGTSDARELQ